MAVIGFGVTLRGYHFEDSHFTFKLASGINETHVGRAVTLDTSAANTVKLAGDGDTIIGRLETYEDRVQEGLKVGTVALRFCDILPIKSGLTGAAVVVVGSTVVGAGNGEVKAKNNGTSATPNHNENFVVEVLTNNRAVVVKV